MRRVQFTEQGKRTLQQLHIESQRRIKQAVKRLPQQPFQGHPLTKALLGFYSLHVSKYRAIYTVQGETITIHWARDPHAPDHP